MKTTDYTKTKIDPFAITRDLRAFDADTDNIYQTVAILSKRANQIAVEFKEEFHERASEITSSSNSMDEVFENREQIELARYFEQMPKPAILAIHEFENGDIVYRDPHMEEKK